MKKLFVTLFLICAMPLVAMENDYNEQAAQYERAACARVMCKMIEKGKYPIEMIVETLVAEGADIEAANPHGETALHYAAAEGLFNAAKWLLDHGANHKRLSKIYETPLQRALRAGKTDVAELLSRYISAPFNPFPAQEIPLSDTSSQMSDDLLSLAASAEIVRPATVLQPRPFFNPTLPWNIPSNAAEQTHSEVNLPAAPINLNQQEPEQPQPDRTPAQKSLDHRFLNACYFNERLPKIKKLVDKGADIHTQHHGKSALHYAAMNGNDALMSFLIDRGAMIDEPDEHGITPVQVAAQNDHPSCVKILSQHGACVTEIILHGKYAGKSVAGIMREEYDISIERHPSWLDILRASQTINDEEMDTK